MIAQRIQDRGSENQYYVRPPFAQSTFSRMALQHQKKLHYHQWEGHLSHYGKQLAKASRNERWRRKAKESSKEALVFLLINGPDGSVE